jgi:hypothetical protein
MVPGAHPLKTVDGQDLSWREGKLSPNVPVGGTAR